MANKVYVGINNIARNVNTIYVGVNNVARKIVKGYVGVNGIAKMFFSTATLIPFTSNPAPTSWSGNNTEANAVFSSSNTYGTWSCTSTVVANQPQYCTWEAFDNDGTPYSSGGGSSKLPIVTLMFPTGITINPKKIRYATRYLYTGKIQGLNPSTNTWEDLLSISGTKTESDKTGNVTTSNYYSKIRLQTLTRSSGTSVWVTHLQILEGTIKMGG